MPGKHYTVQGYLLEEIARLEGAIEDCDAAERPSIQADINLATRTLRNFTEANVLSPQGRDLLERLVGPLPTTNDYEDPEAFEAE